MKILMPFLVHNGVSIYDDKVMGGLELFSQLLLKNIHEVIPVEITKEDRRSRKAKNIIDFAVWEHKPDVILTNYDTDSYTTKLQKYDIPVMWVWHNQADGSIGRIKSVRWMKEFTDKGGLLYFVSEYQHDVFNAISRRILGHDIERVQGYVRPAFTESLAINEDFKWDATSLARTHTKKNPFWIHNKLKDTDVTSAVITTEGQHLQAPGEQKYYQDNLHWQSPRDVFRGLSHQDCMSTMEKGRVFVSTCTSETFGITALESMARGMPTLLVTDPTMRHASECIADKSSDYRCIRNIAKPEDVAEVIKDMANEPIAARLDRAQRIQAKHSRENWVQDWTTVFDKATRG